MDRHKGRTVLSVMWDIKLYFSLLSLMDTAAKMQKQSRPQLEKAILEHFPLLNIQSEYHHKYILQFITMAMNVTKIFFCWNCHTDEDFELET